MIMSKYHSYAKIADSIVRVSADDNLAAILKNIVATKHSITAYLLH